MLSFDCVCYTYSISVRRERCSFKTVPSKVIGVTSNNDGHEHMNSCLSVNNKVICPTEARWRRTRL